MAEEATLKAAPSPAAVTPGTAGKTASKAEDSPTAGTAAPSDNPATADTAPSASEAKTTAQMNGDKADAPAEDAAIAEGTPSSSKKDGKRRKSGAAVPEHKNKAIKKKQVALHLDAHPGQFWFVRMKGYPLWPSVICDEDMLPEPLLQNRPVSAARIDGSYRDDFMEGGKNARDRRYPVMFLGTNEFNWIVNTDLVPLDMEDIKSEVAKESRGKMTIALWDAYKVAAEQHTLDEFKDMLRKHEEAVVADLKERLEKEAKKAEKEEEKKKKAARKSSGGKDEDGDEIMGGTESAKKPKKKAEKRKLPEEEEDGSPPKGPKKIKLKTKDADVANEETKKKPEKAKKSKGSKKEEVAALSLEPEQTEKEKAEKKQKNVLYLRHKLQKGFLSRDQAPKEEEMNDMNGYFVQLESQADLDVQTIRATKINKVLKAILKLESIPKDEEYHFKDRSSVLLNDWNKLLSATGAADGDASVETPTTADAPKSAMNGTLHDDDATKSEEPQKDAAMSEPSEAPKETSAADEADVSMADAKSVDADAPSTASAEEDKPVSVSEAISSTA